MSHLVHDSVRVHCLKLKNILTEQKFRYITDKRKVSLTPKGKSLQLEVSGYCGRARVYATAVCAKTAAGLQSHPHEIYGDRWDTVQDGLLATTLEIGEQSIYELPPVFFHKTKQNEARRKLEARTCALQSSGIHHLIHVDCSRNDYKYEEFCLVVLLCRDNGTFFGVVSDPICDNGKDDWQIDRLSAVSGPASGGTEITLTTPKFLKGYDVVFESRDGSWKDSGRFGPALHRVSLLVEAPRYPDLKIKESVDVDVYLERTVEFTDDSGVKQKRTERTEAKTWTYTPVLTRPPEEGIRARKRKKLNSSLVDKSANYVPRPLTGFPGTVGSGNEAAADGAGRVGARASGAGGEYPRCTLNGAAYRLEPSPGVGTAGGYAQLTMPGGETFCLVPAARDPAGVAIGHQVGPPLGQGRGGGLSLHPREPPPDTYSCDDFMRDLLAVSPEVPADADGLLHAAAFADDTETGSFLSQQDHTIGTAYEYVAAASTSSVTAPPVVTDAGNGPVHGALDTRTSGKVFFRRSLSSSSGQGLLLHPALDVSPPDSGSFSLEPEHTQDQEPSMDELLNDLQNPPIILADQQVRHGTGWCPNNP